MLDPAKKLLPQFLDESTNLITDSRQFLQAVAQGQQMTVGSLKMAHRCAHTLRGTAALVKLETVRRIARLLEDTLEKQLQKKRVPSRGKVELLTHALTTLEAQIELVRNGQETDPEAALALEESFAQLIAAPSRFSAQQATEVAQPSPREEEQDNPTAEKGPEPTEAVSEEITDVPMNVCCRFQIEKWDLHLPMADMVEIAQLPQVTPLPFAPAYVRGLINLRGKVIPVIDLGCAWGAPAADLSQCSLVIARTTEENLGFLADRMPHLSPEFSGDFFDLIRFAETYGVNISS